MQYRKQHWVPQSYLYAWCDPDIPEGQEKYVWLFSNDGSQRKRKSPKNIFYEPDIYTIHLNDGSRVLDIEHGLAGLERAFSDVRRNCIDRRKILTSDEKLIVLAFIAASFSRTRSERDHLKKVWEEVLELGEHMRKAYENASPEELKHMPSIGPISPDSKKLSYEDVKRLEKNPMQETLITSTMVQTELFTPMNLSFLCTENDPGFITSDSPCVWFDPEAYKRPQMYRSPGLMYPKIEITLPISPNQLALLSWAPLDMYINIQDNILDDFNRRTRFFSEEYFVVKRNFIKDIWFDQGTPPEK